MVGEAGLRDIDRVTDTSPPTEPQPEPRRLTRSSTDSLVAGVAGGLGRHLNVDPLIRVRQY